MVAPVQHLVMQVRTGSLPAAAAFAHLVAAFHLHPFHHADGFHVGVTRFVTESVVDDQRVPIAEKLVFHLRYHPVAGSIDRAARRHREIHAAVHPEITVNRIGPETVGAGKVVFVLVGVHGRNGGHAGNHVPSPFGKGGHIVEGTALYARFLGQDVQAAGGARKQAPPVQFVQVGVAVHAAETGIPHLVRDGIHAEQGTIHILVARGERLQNGIVAVHAAVHQFDTRAPPGIDFLQKGRLGRLPAQDRCIDPEIQDKERQAAQEKQEGVHDPRTPGNFFDFVQKRFRVQLVSFEIRHIMQI